jgi:hypothetical protein
MLGFIEVTELHSGTPLTIATHTIGRITPHLLKGDDFSTPKPDAIPCTSIFLSFGKSGKEEYLVKEQYDEVLTLLKEAQDVHADSRPAEGIFGQLFELQAALVAAKDETIALLRTT